jgi:hypothetical protein
MGGGVMPFRKIWAHHCPFECRELELLESMPNVDDAGTKYEIVSWYCPECRQIFSFVEPAEDDS